MEFDNLDLLAKCAIREIYDNNTLFLCNYKGCKFSTLYKTEFDNHIEYEHNTLYICSCDFVTNSEKSYLSHTDKYH